MRDAAQVPEKVKGVVLMDEGGADLTITRIATVQGRTFYRAETNRASFEFYVTTKGLIRGLDYT